MVIREHDGQKSIATISLHTVLSRRAVMKRAAALGVSATAVSALLAACGGSSATSTPAPTTSAAKPASTTGTGATTAPAVSTGAPAASAASGAATAPSASAASAPVVPAAGTPPSTSPVTLNLWSGYSEMDPFYKYVADQYKKIHPNVTVNVTSYELRGYEQKLAVTLPSNSAAEIIQLASSTAGRYVQANLFPEVPKNVADFVRSPAFNSLLQSDAIYKDKVYSVPIFGGRTALYYNTDMFKTVGLTTPPKTMDEITAYAQKLTQRDASGNMTVSGLSLRLSGGGSGVSEKFWIWMHQFGGALIKEVSPGKWANGYDNDAGRKTLQFYVDAVNKLKIDDPTIKHDSEAFELGATAMFVRESNVIGDIKDKAPTLKYNTTPLPNGTISSSENLFVTKAAKDPATAWDFILFSMKPEYQQWLLENVGWLPNRQDVDYTAVFQKIPQFEAFLKKPDATFTLFDVPALSAIDEIETKLEAEHLVSAYVDKSLVDNPTGIAKVIKDAAAQTDSILKQAGLA
jgi:multiple sugar transport system substrate-binding protein